MAQGFRPERVGDQIRAELSDLLAREVHDPGIGFVTVTRVRVSPDLQVARVYYTSLGDERTRKVSSRALRRATPFLRHQIGQRLRLRRVPVIEFVFDESVEGQDRIERIIRQWHETEGAASRTEGSAPEAEGVAPETAGAAPEADDSESHDRN